MERRVINQKNMQNQVKNRRVKITPSKVVLTLFMVMFTFFIVHREMEADKLNKEVIELQNLVDELMVKKGDLENELAPFTKKERVVKYAKEQLNMDFPSEKQIGYIEITDSPIIEEKKAPVFIENVKNFIFALFRY